MPGQKPYEKGDVESKLSSGNYTKNYTPAKIILALYENSDMTAAQIMKVIEKNAVPSVTKNLVRMADEGLVEFEKGYVPVSLQMDSLHGANCRHYWLSDKGTGLYDKVNERTGQQSKSPNIIREIQVAERQ